MDIESRFQDTVLADPGELGWGWRVCGGVSLKRELVASWMAGT